MTSHATRPLTRLLVGAYYIVQPVLKPVLKATVGRNERVWRRLRSARDKLVSGSSLPAGLDEPLPRRVYGSVSLVLGPPARLILKKTVGRNQRLWERIRRLHSRLLRGAPAAAWTREPSDDSFHAGVRRRSFGVNLAGYLTSEKGTGEAARSAATVLSAAGVPLALNNIIDTASANKETPPGAVRRENPYAINIAWINGDQAANFAFHKGSDYFKGRYNIGAWAWEVTDFPEEWMPRFQYFDEIWVPSIFVQEALSRVAPIPVTSMHHAVQRLPASEPALIRSRLHLGNEDYIFLFMFDFHSVFERKNPLGLIEAFKKAFRPDDAATLVIKSVHASRRAVRMMREAARGSRTIVTDVVFNRDEIGALYSACDCYVSLHRSEGFGLTLAEAMAAGKPVIATGYSGNMDFMTPDNSYPVRYNLIELDRDYGPYKRGWSWADPDPDHAAELMRDVYGNRSDARAIGRKAAEDIPRLLGPNVVGDMMRRRLTAIASDLGVPLENQP